MERRLGIAPSAASKNGHAKKVEPHEANGLPLGLKTLLSKLRNVRRRGEGWQACCPAHDDTDPSLSISIGGGGRILACCHAGCSFNDIAAALQMHRSEFTPDNSGPVPAPMKVAAGRTDAANAARLIEQHGENVRWNGAWDKFIIWDGKRWKNDIELVIHSLAKQTAKNLWAEFATAAQSGVDKDTIGAMCGFVRTSNNVNGIQAMVSLARSEPGAAIRVDDLDSDPWLFNAENGTVDLRDGKLLQHRRDDFITKLAPVVFDADATCPAWLKFLDTTFAGNDKLISYIQRLVGTL